MLRPFASRPWRPILAAAAGLLLGTALARPAGAGMVITVQNVSAAAGSTGNTLEVDLTNTGTAPVDVASFAFELTVPSASGISFNGADINTSLDPYIFAGTSFLGPNISASTGSQLDAGDLGVPATTMAAGETLGLGRVFFDVAGSTPNGPVTVTINPDPTATNLTDPNGGSIPVTAFNNGTITIRGGAIPEPSALIPATLGLLGASWMVRGSRRARR